MRLACFDTFVSEKEKVSESNQIEEDSHQLAELVKNNNGTGVSRGKDLVRPWNSHGNARLVFPLLA